MRETFRAINLNFAALPVPGGVAGAPLLAMVVITAIVLPEARWLLLFGTVGGVLSGLAMILARRRRRDEPGGNSPNVLFQEVPVPTNAGEHSLGAAGRAFEKFVPVA
jgi:LPXTG-motif cell wall-anchored protein